MAENRPRRRLVAADGGLGASGREAICLEGSFSRAGKLRGVPGRKAAERVSSGPLPILAAKAATAIPVVFAAAGDPVATPKLSGMLPPAVGVPWADARHVQVGARRMSWWRKCADDGHPVFSTSYTLDSKCPYSFSADSRRIADTVLRFPDNGLLIF